MPDSDHAERYRSVLVEIVRLGTTPDTDVVGTLPNGEIGTIWSVGGKERVFDQIIRIAEEALAMPGDR